MGPLRNAGKFNVGGKQEKSTVKLMNTTQGSISQVIT